jgi:NAD-dependent dihydropyrimidine dehydrogenase PreA subunit
MTRVTVDPRRCEAKLDCIRVCPEHVFAMRTPAPGQPWYIALKVRIHGGKQAAVVNEAACTACMKCVDVCPEGAIQVVPDAGTARVD